MAYGKGGALPISSARNSNGHQADIKLSINTPEGDYLCQSLKNYTEKASIVQDLDQTDSFIKLSSFSKNFAALTVHNAKAIVIKNISNVATELCITYYDWRNDGGADAASDTTTDDQRIRITDYLLAKHGLERIALN